MLFNQENVEKMNVKNEILSGLTVALALVPEAVAFALVAGVKPLVGLYAAFLVGLITSILGGRPGMISGATGGLAVVMVALVAQHGVEYLFAAVVVMGIIQILVGILKLGKFVRIIPHPVMLGFVNGLAIVIFLAQLNQFKVASTDGTLHWMTGSSLWIMVGLVALTMMITYFLPKLTKAIPASLFAIIVVSVLANTLDLDTRTVGDIARVGGGLPQFHIPNVPINLETLRIIFPYAVIFAAVGLIESLMTLTLVDEITDTRGRSNKECMGQGLANIITGFFGGMGGCAMIGQSMININSGGRRRLSGISASLFLLGFILFGANLIEKIPLAALTGVMFMVVIATFEWASFRIMRNIPKADAFVIVLVSVVTVFEDLAIAVGVGVIVSSLVFAWEKGKRIDVNTYIEENGTKVYQIRGAVFFGSSRNFVESFDIKNDPEDIVIDFMHARVFDHTGIESINTLTEKYKNLDKKLHLKHLSTECYAFIKDAKEIVEVNIIEDPKYHVALNELG
ncbi:SulP family inorganic anion transporter [Crassaminicella profunda]|uniref:SulP family inorganic anion transporter n=1 Tax=Crassaminicella profunda TaxID=1286698 RepID=UPI001CA7822C|nr:SulP family inorganic anion transporter [Crassaminicella profunda]QZY56408.1 SulP family inorganic anion transporter [Crassaminicella profunda]